MSTDLTKESTTLLIGKNYSKFASDVTLRKDSLLQATYGTSVNEQTVRDFGKKLESLPKTQNRFIIFKNSFDKKITYIDRINSTYYSNEIPLSTFNWKIFTGDTMTVSGYLCKRATTYFAGRFYEAWFNEQIPVSDGPYKFCGLPGLIIKVTDSRQHFSFQISSLRDLRTSAVFMEPFGKSTRPATMSEIYKGQRQATVMMQSGQSETGFQLSPERKQELRDQLKHRNNPIELK